MCTDGKPCPETETKTEQPLEEKVKAAQASYKQIAGPVFEACGFHKISPPEALAALSVALCVAAKIAGVSREALLVETARSFDALDKNGENTFAYQVAMASFVVGAAKRGLGKLGKTVEVSVVEGKDALRKVLEGLLG